MLRLHGVRRKRGKLIMKHSNLLEIKDLHVSSADGVEILHGVNLEIGRDETHVLMGPNGTGKSTLGYAITGNPAYTVTSGEIVFDGENIVDMPVNERAHKGIFLSFQNPLEVPGVTLSAFIRSALEQKTGSRLRLWDFKKRLSETMKLLNMDESYAERDLNVGFSGGEKKKAEILQMLMLGAQAGHTGRNRLWSRRRRGSHRIAGRAALSRARKGFAADNHSQHPHTRGAECRSHARNGKRRDGQGRRRGTGR